MNRAIADALVAIVDQAAVSADSEFVPYKSGRVGGGTTLRWKAASGHFFIVLWFVRDRDDVHLDFAWSKRGRQPSEELWVESINEHATPQQRWMARSECWLRPEQVSPAYPSAFRLENDHPPLPLVRELVANPRNVRLREAFPAFDPENPESLLSFGWDLCELFGHDLSAEDVRYALGALPERLVDVMHFYARLAHALDQVQA